MRIIQLLLLLLSFSFLKGIEGQNIQAERFSKEQLVWHNNAAIRAANRNTDYILYTLATLNTKPLNELRISYDFSTHIFIPNSNSSYADVRLAIDELQISGDITYRSFDLSYQLIPDLVKANFTLALKEGHSATQLIEFSLQQTNWPLTVSLVENVRIEGANVRLRINQLDFSDEAVAVFTEKVTEVNNFWASLNLMDSLMKRINKHEISNGNNPEDLLIYWDLCRKANTISKELAARLLKRKIRELLEKEEGEKKE